MIHSRQVLFTTSAIISMAAVTPAVAQVKNFNIPAQAASTGITQFGRQADVQIGVARKVARGKRTNVVRGQMSVLEALDQLLRGSGLKAQATGTQTYTVVPLALSGDASNPAATLATAQSAPSAMEPEEAGSAANGDIVVTAQKRSERLSDVPMSVAVLSGDKMIEDQVTTLQDIASRVPGVRIISTNGAYNEIVIRGISSGASTNASVATYVDETPYTAVGPFSSSSTLSPNLDPYDLARVEILRGPQGTLYGASALAGLIKYVTNAPDPSRFAGSLLVGASTLRHGSDGYELHGMVNIPISDRLALRVVGNDTRFPGFVDVPARSVKDVNKVRRYGARASLLWNATDDFSIRLSADFQRINVDDDPSFTTGLASPRAGYGPYFRDPSAFATPQSLSNQIYNGTLTWNVGPFDVTSSTSLTRGDRRGQTELASLAGPLSSILGGQFSGRLDVNLKPKAFIQELRLSSSDNTAFKWTVGGYYNDAETPNVQLLLPFNIATGQAEPNRQPALGRYDIFSTYRELAAFANATVRITSRFEIGAGGRYSDNRQSYSQVNAGLFTGTNNFVTRSSEHVFTYSLDAKYKLTPSDNIYARLATGFVPGGPNNAVPGFNLPNSFNSSTTTNYEVGIKGSHFGGGLSYDISIFNVDWSNIQLTAQFGNLFAITNAGSARSRGVEGAVAVSPIPGLSTRLAITYTDAKLKDPTPASVGGNAGDRLPESPPLSGTLGASYERPISGNVRGFAGFDWAYAGSRLSSFSTFGPRTRFDSYNTIDARVGLATGAYRFTVYAKNLTNEEIVTSVTPATFNGVAQNRITILNPRTIGFTISAGF